MDPDLLERITARRAELDELEEQLAKRLAEVRAERDELAVVDDQVFGSDRDAVNPQVMPEAGYGCGGGGTRHGHTWLT
ncbi:hypothetical protein [Streptomyces sasae]|uniref:hypothetical protein n=1 Tax=Streptomyces sasae TaxID=1266772 RepID=UPI002931E46D|nr:hypothetical protein [Streptomyces sasae]